MGTATGMDRVFDYKKHRPSVDRQAYRDVGSRGPIDRKLPTNSDEED